MTFLERLFGRRRDDTDDVPDATARHLRQQNAARSAAGMAHKETDDERAIARYRYLLRTAPPETIEEAHAEAFARLTPEQRRLVLRELSREMPEREVTRVTDTDDPRAIARAATRAELRRPGALERAFGGPAPGYGAPSASLGDPMAGGFLGSIAGVVVGTAVADAFFHDAGFDQGFSEDFGGGDADLAADYDASTLGTDYGDPGIDIGGDPGTDLQGDFGTDVGGDFGGDF